MFNSKTFHKAIGESGQITILILAFSLVLLTVTCLVGALAQLLVSQQRLNTKAESVALAGAQELEFNQAQACEIANQFSTAHYALNAECVLQVGSINILLREPNPNPFFSKILPIIYATSRAGIATADSFDSVD
jgi:secretion/DNA translocation related TadE-like protein